MEAQDPDLYRVVDFYRLYRALVRLKVACLAGDAAEIDRHVALTRRLLAPRPFAPFVLATTGLVATGKSAVAEALAGVTYGVWLSSDRVRKARLGLAPTESAVTRMGQGAYTRRAQGRGLRRPGPLRRRGPRLGAPGDPRRHLPQPRAPGEGQPPRPGPRGAPGVAPPRGVAGGDPGAAGGAGGAHRPDERRPPRALRRPGRGVPAARRGAPGDPAHPLHRGGGPRGHRGGGAGEVAPGAGGGAAGGAEA